MLNIHMSRVVGTGEEMNHRGYARRLHRDDSKDLFLAKH